MHRTGFAARFTPSEWIFWQPVLHVLILFQSSIIVQNVLCLVKQIKYVSRHVDTFDCPSGNLNHFSFLVVAVKASFIFDKKLWDAYLDISLNHIHQERNSEMIFQTISVPILTLFFPPNSILFTSWKMHEHIK